MARKHREKIVAANGARFNRQVEYIYGECDRLNEVVKKSPKGEYEFNWVVDWKQPPLPEFWPSSPRLRLVKTLRKQ